MAGSITKDLQNYSCPLCLEIFESPLSLPCQHSFCSSCIRYFNRNFCPICRKEFAPNLVKPSLELDKQLKELVTLCSGCQDEVVLSDLRDHNNSCKSLQHLENSYLQSIIVRPGELLVQENRHTFTCPYCGLSHLDHTMLTNHCNMLHRHELKAVVCPICSSMPWGDPNFSSSNFIGHLNRRHKFEYDTYVDYGKNEEEMLKEAMMASLNEH